MTFKMLHSENFETLKLYHVTCQFCLEDEINNIFNKSRLCIRARQ